MTARNQNIIPKGFKLKSSITSKRAKKILEEASKKLERERINFYRWKNIIKQRELIINQVKENTSTHLFNNIKSHYKKTLDNIKRGHKRKLSKLQTASPDTKQKNTVVSISTHIIGNRDSRKRLRFCYRIQKQHYTGHYSHPIDGKSINRRNANELRWKVKSIIEEQLKTNKNIKILPADKGNVTATYRAKNRDGKHHQGPNQQRLSHEGIIKILNEQRKTAAIKEEHTTLTGQYLTNRATPRKLEESQNL
ncbi:unnamed protein product [Brassicogethes aeneus]|uniref:Uncharacterized protein n=1 Tax=Brassicogethes aeneus TaxID=1431903 RepID=A0A9P0AYM5_BRAAE|nr:unnamed protein product [Brassicogethes aeneus]